MYALFEAIHLKIEQIKRKESCNKNNNNLKNIDNTNENTIVNKKKCKMTKEGKTINQRNLND